MQFAFTVVLFPGDWDELAVLQSEGWQEKCKFLSGSLGRVSPFCGHQESLIFDFILNFDFEERLREFDHPICMRVIAFVHENFFVSNTGGAFSQTKIDQIFESLIPDVDLEFRVIPVRAVNHNLRIFEKFPFVLDNQHFRVVQVVWYLPVVLVDFPDILLKDHVFRTLCQSWATLRGERNAIFNRSGDIDILKSRGKV